MELEPTIKENAPEMALALKQKIRKSQKRLRSRIMGKFVVVGIFVIAALIVRRLQPNGHSYLLMGYPVGVMIGLVITLVWTKFFDKKQKRQIADYKNALLKMAGTDDINAIGLLLEEAYQYDFTLRQDIRAALVRLLPRLQSENAPALDEQQRKTLTYLPFVTGEVNPNLRLAALQAIAQVGNAEALRIVKKNRQSTGQEHGTELRSPISGPRQRNVQIKIRKLRRDLNAAPLDYVTCFQSAVEDCIVELEARLARENAADTLLRASQSDGNESGTLLRPAANTQSHNAELLRPASAETNRGKD